MAVAACNLMNKFSIFGDIPTLWPPPLQQWMPELRFQPPVQLGCMHMTDLSSTNQMYCVKNSFLKWVKCANNSCAKLSILLHGWWQGYWAFIRGWWGEEGFWRQQQQHLLHNPNSASVFLEIVSGSLAPSLVSSPPNCFVHRPTVFKHNLLSFWISQHKLQHSVDTSPLLLLFFLFSTNIHWTENYLLPTMCWVLSQVLKIKKDTYEAFSTASPRILYI